LEPIEKRIITHSEWSEISDAIFLVRRAYNKPNRADDCERLEQMEKHLGDAMMACRKVRERWNSQQAVVMDILADKGK